MQAARILLVVFAITLAGGIRPARTDTVDISPSTLPKAVSALESATGGKVLEIRLVDEAGHERFESVVAGPDGVIYMSVNTVTNEITQIDIKQRPAWMLGWKLTAYVKSIQKAKVRLDEAVSRAEGESRAPAIGAGLAKPLSGANEVLAYDIELVKDGRRERVAIDAMTGLKIANPDELYEPWTPVVLLRKS